MKRETLRRYLDLHSWVGILGGFVLFAAFYAGAITVFHEELHHWQEPALESKAPDMAAWPALLDQFVRKYPDAKKDFLITLPSDEHPLPQLYWRNAQEDWQQATLTADREAPIVEHRAGSELADLVNELHFSLALPSVGLYWVGVAALFYGIALVSGLVLHWPQLREDLFALRSGRNRKRFWQDAHNVIGILSFPFHLIFSVTGAVGRDVCFLSIADLRRCTQTRI